MKLRAGRPVNPERGTIHLPRRISLKLGEELVDDEDWDLGEYVLPAGVPAVVVKSFETSRMHHQYAVRVAAQIGTETKYARLDIVRDDPETPTTSPQGFIQVVGLAPLLFIFIMIVVGCWSSYNFGKAAALEHVTQMLQETRNDVGKAQVNPFVSCLFASKTPIEECIKDQEGKEAR
jgi:hypothetical protein